MLKTALALLLCLDMAAAAAADHLIPMDPGMNSLHQNFGKYWFAALKKGDITFLEFDVFPAMEPMPSYLAVIGPSLQGPFRLCYQKNSYDKASSVCTPLPVEFATALDARVEKIIRRDTFYDPKPGVSPLDPTSYYFKANFVYGESRYADSGSVPDQLIHALRKCALLATQPAADPHRQARMDEILKDLDAIELPP